MHKYLHAYIHTNRYTYIHRLYGFVIQKTASHFTVSAYTSYVIVTETLRLMQMQYVMHA